VSGVFARVPEAFFAGFMLGAKFNPEPDILASMRED
jgi:hypothetical protein